MNSTTPDTPITKNVFISYRKDDVAAASLDMKKLKRKLEEKFKSLKGSIINYDLVAFVFEDDRVGGDLRGYFRDRIKESDAMVLVFSQDVDSSAECKFEWDCAIRENKHIIPLLVKTKVEDLANHDLLGKTHYLHKVRCTIYDGTKKSFNDLVNVIIETLKKKQPQPLRTTKSPSVYDPRTLVQLGKLYDDISSHVGFDTPDIIHIQEPDWFPHSSFAWEWVKSYFIRNHFEDGIFWIDLNEGGQKAWWGKIEDKFPRQPSEDNHAYIRRITDGKKCLFILDNYDGKNESHKKFFTAVRQLHVESRLIIATKMTHFSETPHHVLKVDLSVPLTKDEAEQCLKHYIPTLDEKSAEIKNIAIQIIDHWRDPFALFLIAKRLLEDRESDEHWQRIFDEFINGNLDNEEVNLESDDEEINFESEVWKQLAKIIGSFAKQTGIPSKKLDALTVFRNDTRITFKAFHSLWGGQETQARGYLTRLEKAHLIEVQVAEDEPKTYLLYPAFSHWIKQKVNPSQVMEWHLNLLKGYYSEGIEYPTRYTSWNNRVDDYLSKELFYHLKEANQKDIILALLVEDKNWFNYRTENGMFREYHNDIREAKQVFEDDKIANTQISLAQCHLNASINGGEGKNLIIEVLFEDVAYNVQLNKIRQRQDHAFFSGILALREINEVTLEDLKRLREIAEKTAYTTAYTQYPTYIDDVVQILLSMEKYDEVCSFMKTLKDHREKFNHEENRNRRRAKDATDKAYFRSQIKIAKSIHNKEADIQAKLKAILHATPHENRLLSLLIEIIDRRLSIEGVYNQVVAFGDDIQSVIVTFDMLINHYQLDDLIGFIQSSPENAEKQLYLIAKLAVVSKNEHHLAFLQQQFTDIYPVCEQGYKEKLGELRNPRMYPSSDVVNIFVTQLQKLCGVAYELILHHPSLFQAEINRIITFIETHIRNLASQHRDILKDELALIYATEPSTFHKAIELAADISERTPRIRCMVKLYKQATDAQRNIIFYRLKDIINEKDIETKSDSYKQLAISLYNYDKNHADQCFEEIQSDNSVTPWAVLPHLLIYLSKNEQTAYIKNIFQELIDDPNTQSILMNTRTGSSVPTQLVNILIPLAIRGNVDVMRAFVAHYETIIHPVMTPILRICTLLQNNETDNAYQLMSNLLSKKQMGQNTETKPIDPQLSVSEEDILLFEQLDSSSKRLLVFAIATQYYKDKKYPKTKLAFALYKDATPDEFLLALNISQDLLKANDIEVVKYILKKLEDELEDQKRSEADEALYNERQTELKALQELQKPDSWVHTLNYCQQKNNIRDFIITLINHHPAFGDESYATITKIIKMMTWADGMRNSLWDKINNVLNP